MARNYKNLEIWRISYGLVLDFYKVLEKFPKDESDNLISQIRRAATSVPLNIAEGCSRQHKKAFIQFLVYAYGSVKELGVLIMLSRDLKYINLEEFNYLNNKLEKLGAMMYKFMHKVDEENFFKWFKRK